MTEPAAPPVFFGYWAGRVPALAELHVRSLLHHHPRARYELWLDTDLASTVEAPELRWLASDPRIVLRAFSLDALIERHVTRRPVRARDPLAPLRRLGRALHRVAGPQWTRRQAWEHPDKGLSYRHGSALFAGFRADRVYRSRLARCLLPLEHYAGPCLYADLDVAFCTDLLHHWGDKAWVYRWQARSHGCPSVTYLPSRSWSAALVRRGNELGSYEPWVLFSDAECAALGIVVQPARLFDPVWDSTSLLYGEPARFLARRDHLALDLHALATERHLAIRWHAPWDARPDPESLYAGLLRACTGEAAG
jgi:hypothetical protein